MQNRKKKKERHRFIEQSFRFCGRRRGWDVSREQHRNVYYLGWNRSPSQVGCIRQALRPGALGRPRGSGWRGRWEGGSGWGTHVNPWLFHFNVWQNSLQYKKKKKVTVPFFPSLYLLAQLESLELHTLPLYLHFYELSVHVLCLILPIPTGSIHGLFIGLY